MRSRRSLATVLVIALVVAGAACGSPDDDDGGRAAAEGSTSTTDTSSTSAPASEPSDEPAEDGPVEVEERTERWVDTTRPTAAGTETPEAPERTITTRIAHPTGGGPYPLLVLSHGATGHPDEYAEQIPQWAAEGFVVAAPMFPLTNRDVPGALGNIGDVANQPGDVSFVIDQVIAAGDDPDSPLHGLVDGEAIGLVGHSLGAATTWAAGFNTATRDDRVDSVTIFAGLTLDIPGGTFAFDSGLPLLVLHGDADDVPLGLDQAAYDQATSPKWFVTLHGADHRLAFTDEESPWDELVTTTIVDFWHGTLDADDEALARVTDDATDPELSTVQQA